MDCPAGTVVTRTKAQITVTTEQNYTGHRFPSFSYFLFVFPWAKPKPKDPKSILKNITSYLGFLRNRFCNWTYWKEAGLKES